MATMRPQLDAPVLVGVGAAFDFLSGTVAQAPSWMQRAGLEWLFRLTREPKRLWRRYARYNPRFVAGFAREWWGMRQSTRGTVDVTVTGRTAASAEVAFDTIAPIDLASIFERWLLIPGVRGVRDQSGPWDAAGRTRTVQLTDGSEAPERLTGVDRPRAFSYRVGPFPRPLGLLASSADGDWSFTPAQGGGTDIRWTYRFTAGPGRRTLVRALIAPMWRGYSRRGLERAVAAADAAAVTD
jgi:hypothetical protein